MRVRRSAERWIPLTRRRARASSAWSDLARNAEPMTIAASGSLMSWHATSRSSAGSAGSYGPGATPEAGSRPRGVRAASSAGRRRVPVGVSSCAMSQRARSISRRTATAPSSSRPLRSARASSRASRGGFALDGVIHRQYPKYRRLLPQAKRLSWHAGDLGFQAHVFRKSSAQNAEIERGRCARNRQRLSRNLDAEPVPDI